MRLQTKLFVSKLGLTAVPVVLVSSVVLWKTNGGFKSAVAEAESSLAANNQESRTALISSGKTDLTHIAEMVYSLCAAQQETLEEKIGSDLRVARKVLTEAGNVHFSAETAQWDVVNQYSGTTARLALPRMLVGDVWFGQNRDPKVTSPVVDDVEALVGSTCTIFQRMNEAGDMLRVCTNVVTKEGARAIGTYIPTTNPDQSPNPVVSTVLKGDTFVGRAFVVNAWYITAYEPILDADKKVVGMLYVGVPEQSSTALREAIMNIKVGKTGYVYVLNATGSSRGNYVISQGGKRDGENIWSAKDATGRSFIQEICEKAVKLKPAETGEVTYAWQNPGESAPRDKIVRIAYFAPWDWVIGVGAYEDEFLEAVNAMDARAHQSVANVRAVQATALGAVKFWSITIGAIALLVAFGVAYVVVRGITRPLARVITDLNEGAMQVNDAAGQVASASGSLAEGANEQAASLEETAATLEEITAQANESAVHAREANDLASQARTAADDGGQTMANLNTAMAGINDSSQKISRIIKVIEEISFQTNLLALNAAVEAARAGEHGKGFAVVADEVRSLAQRAATAARETTALIEDAVDRARTGEQIAVEAGRALSEIARDVSQVSDLLQGIARGSKEQANSVRQVNTAVSQLDKVTQQNASSAEETAAAAEQLSAQAASVRGSVEQLSAIMDPSRRTAFHVVTP